MFTFKITSKCSFRIGFTIDGEPTFLVQGSIHYVPQSFPYTYYREVRTCFHDIANSIKMQEFKRLFDIQEDTPINFDARGPLYTFSEKLFTKDEIGYYGIKNYVPVTVEQIAMVPKLVFQSIPVEYHEPLYHAGKLIFQCGISCSG